MSEHENKAHCKHKEHSFKQPDLVKMNVLYQRQCILLITNLLWIC